MGGFHLICFVTPLFWTHIWDSHILESFAFYVALGKVEVADELSKWFIEPEVIPPFHGDEISKPMVGEFVCNNNSEVGDSGWVNLFLENVGIVEGNAASIFHGTHIELRTEDLIVLGEWVLDLEIIFIDAHGLICDFEDEVL